MELKTLDSVEATMNGTFKTIDNALGKMLIGAADIVGNNKIIPRADLKLDDFNDIWWVGDYPDKNGDTNGGFIAIKLINALSTGGLSIQTTKNGKGQISVTFTGHLELADPSVVPMVVYVYPAST
jgi:hypothetical protein